MTVAAVVPRSEWQGDGETTTFTFQWPYYDSSDVKVWVNDTPATGYSVAPGVLTFATAPVSGAQILALRQTPESRSTSYMNGAPIDAPALNQDLDRVVTMVQDVGARDQLAAETIVEVDGKLNTLDQAVSAAQGSASQAQSSASTAGAYATQAQGSASAAQSSAEAADASASQAKATLDSAATTIGNAQTQAVNAVTSARDAATESISSAESGAVTAITQRETTALTDISHAGTAAVNGIANQGEASANAIVSAGNQAAQDIVSAGTSARAGIASDLTAGLNQLDAAQKAASDTLLTALAASVTYDLTAEVDGTRKTFTVAAPTDMSFAADQVVYGGKLLIKNVEYTLTWASDGTGTLTWLPDTAPDSAGDRHLVLILGFRYADRAQAAQGIADIVSAKGNVAASIDSGGKLQLDASVSYNKLSNTPEINDKAIEGDHPGAYYGLADLLVPSPTVQGAKSQISTDGAIVRIRGLNDAGTDAAVSAEQTGVVNMYAQTDDTHKIALDLRPSTGLTLTGDLAYADKADENVVTKKDLEDNASGYSVDSFLDKYDAGGSNVTAAKDATSGKLTLNSSNSGDFMPMEHRTTTEDNQVYTWDWEWGTKGELEADYTGGGIGTRSSLYVGDEFTFTTMNKGHLTMSDGSLSAHVPNAQGNTNFGGWLTLSALTFSASFNTANSDSDPNAVTGNFDLDTDGFFLEFTDKKNDGKTAVIGEDDALYFQCYAANDSDHNADLTFTQTDLKLTFGAGRDALSDNSVLTKGDLSGMSGVWIPASLNGTYGTYATTIDMSNGAKYDIKLVNKDNPSIEYTEITAQPASTGLTVKTEWLGDYSTLTMGGADGIDLSWMDELVALHVGGTAGYDARLVFSAPRTSLTASSVMTWGDRGVVNMLDSDLTAATTLVPGKLYAGWSSGSDAAGWTGYQRVGFATTASYAGLVTLNSAV
jgi:hypothetical protein